MTINEPMDPNTAQALTLQGYYRERYNGETTISDVGSVVSPEITPKTLYDNLSDTDEVWRDFANCLEAGTEIFYPSKGDSSKEAKAICAACVVREDCLEYALSKPEGRGIWGGRSERQRKNIVKSRKLANLVIEENIENN